MLLVLGLVQIEPGNIDKDDTAIFAIANAADVPVSQVELVWVVSRGPLAKQAVLDAAKKNGRVLAVAIPPSGSRVVRMGVPPHEGGDTITPYVLGYCLDSPAASLVVTLLESTSPADVRAGLCALGLVEGTAAVPLSDDALKAGITAGDRSPLVQHRSWLLAQVLRERGVDVPASEGNAEGLLRVAAQTGSVWATPIAFVLPAEPGGKLRPLPRLPAATLLPPAPGFLERWWFWVAMLIVLGTGYLMSQIVKRRASS